MDPPKYLIKKWDIDLSEELGETKRELGVQKLPENLCGAGSLKVLEAANALGYSWDRVDKMIDPSKCIEGCSKCTLGCKRGAKWTVRTYLAEAQEKGSKLYERIDVQAIIHQNGKVTGVWGIDKSGGKVEFRGDKVIVAAGGMNSARILQLSGLWNAGEGFFIDPCVTVFGVYGGPEKNMGMPGDVPMSIGSWEFWDSHGFMLFTFIPYGLLYGAAAIMNNPRYFLNMMRLGRLFGVLVKVKAMYTGGFF